MALIVHVTPQVMGALEVLADTGYFGVDGASGVADELLRKAIRDLHTEWVL